MKNFREKILSLLKTAEFKAALKGFLERLIRKFLKNATFGGIKGWLLGLFVDEVLIKRAIEPSVKLAFRKVGYMIDVREGKRLIRKLEAIERGDDEDSYDDTVDDIMS